MIDLREVRHHAWYTGIWANVGLDTPGAIGHGELHRCNANMLRDLADEVERLQEQDLETLNKGYLMGINETHRRERLMEKERAERDE